MGIPGLIALLVMLVLTGIGIGLFACMIAAALVMLGVVFSSVALGFFTKRPATAVRALLLDFIFRRTQTWLEERNKPKALVS
ncbi:MAG: hypothetical protein B7Z37_00180 [Verrucomicrobia bacterium 12-59-8]|nr:MAG: hypothetical protein B7Z37_00180 [Verrucomicrobia bacterium 12-59-8]